MAQRRRNRRRARRARPAGSAEGRARTRQNQEEADLADRGRRILKRIFVVLGVIATLGGVFGVASLIYDATLKPDPCPEFKEVPASIPRSQVTVSPTEVRAVLADYVRAYGRRDLNAMKNLLSSDHCRYGASGARTRKQTLNEYQRQFNEQKRDTRYALKLEALVPGVDKAIVPGHDEASAQGHYRISYRKRDLGTGAVKFHLVQEGGTLRIDQINFP
jgi:hypothetical protein